MESLESNPIVVFFIGIGVLAKTLAQIILGKNLESNHLVNDEIDVNGHHFLYTQELPQFDSIKEAAKMVKSRLSQPGLYKVVFLIEFRNDKIRIDDIVLINLMVKTGICNFAVIARKLPEKIGCIDNELLTKLNNGKKTAYLDHEKSGKKKELEKFIDDIAISFKVEESYTNKLLLSFSPKNPLRTKLLKNIIAIGNAGVGKSRLLNSLIGKSVFKDGISIGKALTRVLQEYVDERGIRFIDSPGLSDTELSVQALQGIKAALTREGLYKIIFVITLASGRLNPDDKKMMKLVLEAAGFIKCSYAIIINKLEEGVLEYLESNLTEFLDVLMEGLPSRTDCIFCIPQKKTLREYFCESNSIHQ